MQKIGRNDPCPCGSGKKYKKCCMEKDQESNIVRITGSGGGLNTGTRIAKAQGAPHDDYTNLLLLIEEKLEWHNVLYKLVARHIMNNMMDEYEEEQVGVAIILWNKYSSDVQPLMKKAGTFAAAIEYCVARMEDLGHVTQDALARKYDVSVGTISKRAQQIMDYQVSSVLDGGIVKDAPSGPAPLSRLGAEGEFRKISKLLEGKNFESIEEVNAFLNGQFGSTGKLPDVIPMTPKEQAEELVYDAWEEPSDKERVKLAKRALQLYPDSADAYNILAETAPVSLEQSLRYYKRGMEAGERDLGQAFIQENKGHFWGLFETRPYMRAKHGYAETLLLLGKVGEAIQQFEQMIELNPGDNQGVRNRLVYAYLREKLYHKAAQLMDTYDEDTAHANYNRILVEYARNGINGKLGSLLKQARKRNPHVIGYLVGKKKLPRMLPETIGFGDENEAVEYAYDHAELWRREAELYRWLKEQAGVFAGRR
jgi:tetratricopeptide (TPR) repeat protein